MSNPRISVDANFYTHPKILKLTPSAELLWLRSIAYCVQHLTDGKIEVEAPATVLLEAGSASFFKHPISRSFSDEMFTSLLEELVSAGLWKKTENGYIIHDFLDYHYSRNDVLTMRKNKQKAGRLGGLKSSSKRQAGASSKRQAGAEAELKPYTYTYTDTDTDTKKETPIKNTREPKRSQAVAVGHDTWQSYEAAYIKRYATKPVRNHQVNSQVKKFVDLLGQEEAPQVAAFYLTCTAALYVSARHPTNLLVRDATGLRTQWATGNHATKLEARSLEGRSNIQAQLSRIANKMDRKQPLVDITPKKELDHDGEDQRS